MAAPDLAVDNMLGALAKWLRLLGLDALYLQDGPWPAVPGRLLLTRRSDRPHQRRLTGWAGIIRLTANDTPGQLTEIVLTLGLTPGDLAPLTRCSVCNLQLDEIGTDEAAGQVPDYVLATHDRFSACPGCGRIYWPATHARRVAEIIERLFPSV